MELAFETKSLRDICESEKIATKELGAKAAAVLQARLADLAVAQTVKKLPFKAKNSGQTGTILLGHGFQIVFSANHQTVPKLASGRTDWSKVYRIKIIAIEKIR